MWPSWNDSFEGDIVPFFLVVCFVLFCRYNDNDDDVFRWAKNSSSVGGRKKYRFSSFGWLASSCLSLKAQQHSSKLMKWKLNFRRWCWRWFPSWKDRRNRSGKWKNVELNACLNNLIISASANMRLWEWSDWMQIKRAVECEIELTVHISIR